MTTSTNGNGNLIDEFEEAFQHCLNLFSIDDASEYFTNGFKTVEIEKKLDVDQVTHRFIDLARQVEAFFLQKRFLLSALKQELIIKEDVTDLKIEIVRKEELIKKHYEKILTWQNLLSEMHSWVQPNGGNIGLNTNIHACGSNGNNTNVHHILHQQIQQQQQLQMQQLQQQLQQVQGTSGSASNVSGTGISIVQPNIYISQGNATSRSAGFIVSSINNSNLQGPLAFLEKTTSNIGVPERRS
ncbi:mediator of RNA polymerase II transcription subunit 28 isoform X1 [Phymastichus coffea]|uniref:mediator of RNA polymerase II transcription subunit 28 isoform X1 n=1 Tax=Phymastichus coffea TaxID=108790 RepID=UPI00273BD1A3|nr:mediator of RNA polymerase II transcription subunit 28 isoform X1 [Phymastichus coffea]